MKNVKKYALLLLCLPLVLTGCRKEVALQDGKQVVAEINGKQFTAEDLFDELKGTYGTAALVNMIDTYITEQEINDDIKKDALEQAQAMVTNYKSSYNLYYTSQYPTWEKYLAANGFASEKEFLEYFQSNFEQQLVVEKYVKENVIKEEDIQKYYNEDIYGEITVRHILIKPETKTDMTDAEKNEAKEKALATAKELIEQLKNSSNLEEDFSNLAKEKSQDTASATEGGLIKDFTNETGLVEEFWNASLKLEVGKMTEEPIETEYGYHIIYKVSQKEKPSIEDVKEKVIDKVADELLSDGNASQVYWAGLREKYGIKIHDDILKNKYDLTMKSIQK